MMRHDGLAKLAEELGELQQVVGKMLQYPEGPHPDGGPPLEKRFVEEAGDVRAAIDYCAIEGGFDLAGIMDRQSHKFALFMKWRDEDEAG